MYLNCFVSLWNVNDGAKPIIWLYLMSSAFDDLSSWSDQLMIWLEQTLITSSLFTYIVPKSQLRHIKSMTLKHPPRGQITNQPTNQPTNHHHRGRRTSRRPSACAKAPCVEPSCRCCETPGGLQPWRLRRRRRHATTPQIRDGIYFDTKQLMDVYNIYGIFLVYIYIWYIYIYIWYKIYLVYIWYIRMQRACNGYIWYIYLHWSHQKIYKHQPNYVGKNTVRPMLWNREILPSPSQQRPRSQRG